MSCLDLLDAERLAFAKLATETARRTGGRTVSNLELIHCSDSLRLICCDVGGECVTHGLELPAAAWTTALQAEVQRLFQGSAEIALRQIGRTAA